MGLGSARNAVIQQSQQPQSVGGKGAQQPQSVGGKGAQPQQSGRGEFNYGFGSMPQQDQPQRVGGKGIGQSARNFQQPQQPQFPAPRDMYAGMPSPQGSFGFQQNPYAAPFNQYMGGNQPSQQMSPYVSSYYMPQPQMYQQPMYQQPQQMGGKGGLGRMAQPVQFSAREQTANRLPLDPHMMDVIGGERGFFQGDRSTFQDTMGRMMGMPTSPYARQPYQPPQQMGGKGGIPGLGQPPGGRQQSSVPDWVEAPPPGSITGQALTELTNPNTGEKFMAPNTGYNVRGSKSDYEAPPGASFPDRALHDVPMDMRYRGPYIDTSAMRAQREMQARNAEQMVRQGMPSIIRSRQPTQAAQSSITPQDILSMAVRKTPADLRYDANNDGRITSADALAFSKGWRPQAMKKGGEVK